jgi:hypothetical protein
MCRSGGVEHHLSEAAHAMFRLTLDLLASLNGKFADLDKEIATCSQ